MSRKVGWESLGLSLALKSVTWNEIPREGGKRGKRRPRPEAGSIRAMGQVTRWRKEG